MIHYKSSRPTTDGQPGGWGHRQNCVIYKKDYTFSSYYTNPIGNCNGCGEDYCVSAELTVRLSN